MKEWLKSIAVALAALAFIVGFNAGMLWLIRLTGHEWAWFCGGCLFFLIVVVHSIRTTPSGGTGMAGPF